MQRRKTGKISIFNSLDVIFDFLMSWVENLNRVLIQNQYQIESECWNWVFKLSQKIDIKYLSWVRRLILKLNLMISLSMNLFLLYFFFLSFDSLMMSQLEIDSVWLLRVLFEWLSSLRSRFLRAFSSSWCSLFIALLFILLFI